MKIVEDTPTRLVLAGVPGSFRWMLFATVLGGALTAAVVASIVWQLGEGWSFTLIFMGVGLLIAQGIFWMGAVTLAVGRERLELDLTTQRGVYSVRSPIVETGNKPFSFDFVNIHSVTLERVAERRPASEDRAEHKAKIVRCRLRTTKPRRAVVLDETENGSEARVRALAERVATFLDLELTET